MYLLEQRLNSGIVLQEFFASVEDAQYAIGEEVIWAIWERKQFQWEIWDCHPDFLPF